MYNALLSSCLGRSKRAVPSPPSEVAQCIFEMTSQPPNQVSVTLDMQSEETLTGLLYHCQLFMVLYIDKLYMCSGIFCS